MLIKKGPSFIPVTTQAGFVFEASELSSCLRFMRVVAIRAGEDSFLQSMAFIQPELGEDIFMAGETGVC